MITMEVIGSYSSVESPSKERRELHGCQPIVMFVYTSSFFFFFLNHFNFQGGYSGFYAADSSHQVQVTNKLAGL